MKNENVESEIRCPRCNSNQLSANKQGFSFKKAVVGGILTGGVGLLAGAHGSSKIKITCLKCGKVFNPGEGKIITPEEKLEIKKNNNEEIAKNKIARRNSKVVEYSKKSLDEAIKFYMEHEICSYEDAEKKVKFILEKSIIDNRNTKKGCVLMLVISALIILFFYFMLR